MRKPLLLLALALSATVGFVAEPARARLNVMPGWIDRHTLANAVEVRGVVYEGKLRPVNFAYCDGLRRYGVRHLTYTDQYHRFKCSTTGADQHAYAATITITRSILSLTPIAGRDEPAILTRNLRDATEELADARNRIQPGDTAAQRLAAAEFLRPFVAAVEDAQASLEPYRTKFWWRITSVTRIY
jgi:hypothetical protein